MLNSIRPVLKSLEGDKGKFLVSDSPTVADFMLFELCERIQFLSDQKLFEEYPRLQTFHSDMMDLPEVSAYVSGNETFKSCPFNNKEARINN